MVLVLQTPSTSHLSFDNIYEPAEDSFLLLDTIGSVTESTFLQNRYPPSQPGPLIVEVGPGSGVVLAFVSAHAERIFNHGNVMTLGIDFNRKACLATTQTVTRATDDFSSGPEAMFLDTIQGDLGTSLRHGSVDIAIFNPPYVPTEESPLEIRNLLNQDLDGPESKSSRFETDSRLLALSYAGGVDGMETTNQFLEQLKRILHPKRGLAYLLLCAGNKPANVIAQIKSWGPQWDVVIAGHSGKQGGRETLQILRIWRTGENDD